MNTRENSSTFLSSLWPVLLLVYVLLAVLFSVLQPLGRTPDEPAHVEYAKFLATNLRLPVWQEQGGGEAGYQVQHPPLYYSIAAVIYRITSPLEERWRWHVLRWATIAVGFGMFWICRRLFSELLNDERLAWVATATVLLMPLTILYTGHVNPDGLTMFWVTLAFYWTWRTATRQCAKREYAILGVICGLAVLTKLSGLPAMVVALITHAFVKHPSPAAGDVTPRPVRLLLIAIGFFLCSGWWYVRSTFMYGSPVIHTAGKLGTGMDLAARDGVVSAAWLTWRETFLSTWIQRGWMPAGFIEYLLYCIIFAMIALAAGGLLRQRTTGKSGNANETHPLTTRSSALRIALNLSALLILLLFLGQQSAFWTTDVEFNAGGRYLISAIAPIALLLVAGVAALAVTPAFKKAIYGAWLVALILMNLSSAWNIDTVLNPTYAPNWQIFHFPPER